MDQEARKVRREIVARIALERDNRRLDLEAIAFAERALERPPRGQIPQVEHRELALLLSISRQRRLHELHRTRVRLFGSSVGRVVGAVIDDLFFRRRLDRCGRGHFCR